MATLQENIDSMDLAFSTHMKNKNPGVDAQTTANIDDFSLAYATAIANAIGAGTTGISVADYIKKTGGADGVMSGKFTALSGIECGFNYSKQMDTTSLGVVFYSDINHSSGVFKGHSKEIIDHSTNLLKFNGIDEFSSGVYLGGSRTNIKTELLVGTDSASGFFVNNSALQYKGYNLYHSGNSNKIDVDWTMLNSFILGDLSVTGTSTLLGNLSAVNGALIGFDGVSKMEAIEDGIEFYKNIYIPSDGEIIDRYNNDFILKDHAEGSVSISAAGKNLLLGYQNTAKVSLLAGLYNYNSDHLLINRFGETTFDWGFEAGTDGEKRIETNDFGIAVIGSIYINDDSTTISEGDSDLLKISTSFGNVEIGASDAETLSINTDRTKFILNKNLYAEDIIGLNASDTRIEDNKLLLSDDHYLLNVTDGIKHFGRTIITENIGTDSFSSGFSGNGWEIDQDSQATFTNLVVRNKLTVYDFEVEKITAVNGSFWISSGCSATQVTKL